MNLRTFKNQHDYEKAKICDKYPPPCCPPPCECKSNKFDCRLCLNGAELSFGCDDNKKSVCLVCRNKDK